MKRITFLVFALISFIGFSQNVPPTFTWDNTDEITINDELVVKREQVINYTIKYDLGTTGGEQDTFGFILFVLEENSNPDAGINDAGWAKVESAVESYPGVGVEDPDSSTGGMIVSQNYVIPADVELTSEGNKAYRILTYLAYNKGGTADDVDGVDPLTYGGAGASDPQILKIKTPEEEPLLSTNTFSKEKLASVYPNPAVNTVNFGSDVKSDSYQVYNIAGQLVADKKATGSLDVSELSKGTYIIVTDSGNARIVKE